MPNNIININKKDRKRWDRVHKKYLYAYILGWSRSKNLAHKPFIKHIGQLKRYGYASSLLNNGDDYEYQHTPRKCRQIFMRVNIINHFCNNIFFLHEMINKHNKGEDHTLFDSKYSSEIESMLFYSIYPEMGKIKKIYINMPGAKGYCDAAAKLYLLDAPGNTQDSVKENSRRIKFMFAPVSEKARIKFVDAKYWQIEHNPSILIHAVNIKSRIFELRFYPEQKEEYLQSLTVSDQKLAKY